MPTPKPLVGTAAIKELQRQVSPAGVAAAEAKARKAVEKKNGFVSNNGSSITKFTQKLKSLGK